MIARPRGPKFVCELSGTGRLRANVEQPDGCCSSGGFQDVATMHSAHIFLLALFGAARTDRPHGVRIAADATGAWCGEAALELRMRAGAGLTPAPPAGACLPSRDGSGWPRSSRHSPRPASGSAVRLRQVV